MKERRSLAEGLKTASGVDPAVERAFVYRHPPRPTEAGPPAPADAEVREGKGQSPTKVGRVPLTIRFREDLAAVLKRASLQRQLEGVFPHTLQDILEEAVEPWLKSHGYLS
jgi:hypothetical protein